MKPHPQTISQYLTFTQAFFVTLYHTGIELDLMSCFCPVNSSLSSYSPAIFHSCVVHPVLWFFVIFQSCKF